MVEYDNLRLYLKYLNHLNLILVYTKQSLSYVLSATGWSAGCVSTLLTQDFISSSIHMGTL